MKTSTAFAILAVLAAGTNAIPISRRDEDCACELLDPNNTVDDVHTIHKDGSDLIPASQSGNSSPLVDIGAALLSSGQSSSTSTDNAVDSLTNPVVDGAEPITNDDGSFLNNGSPSLLSQPTEESTTEDEDAFANNGGAFRAAKPAQASSTNETSNEASSEGDVATEEDGALQAIDGGEPLAGGDPADLQGLGLAQPLQDGSEPISDEVDTLTSPPPANGNDNTLFQSGEAVNDALSSSTEDPSGQISALSSQPAGQTVDGVSPGTGSQATDAANGPLSNAADSVLPGTGDAVNGPISNAADGAAPGTGSKVNEALASPVGNTAETIVPGSGSAVNDTASGPATTVVDPILPGTGSKVNDVANGPTSSVADPILPDTGAQLTDATYSTADEVADDVVPGTGPTVKDATNIPVKDTANTVIPGTGPIVNDAVTQPVSQTLNNHLSGDHLGDHLDGHHLNQDPASHLQSLGGDKVLSGLQPQAQSNGQSSPSPLTKKVNNAGNLLAASLGSNLLSGQRLQGLGGSRLLSLGRPLSGSSLPPLSAGTLGGIIPNSGRPSSSGSMSMSMSGNVGLSSSSSGQPPLKPTDPLGNILSGGSPLAPTLGNGLPLGGLKDVASGSGPLSSGGDITKPLTSGGNSPVDALTSGGLPLLSGGLPLGSSASPLGNTLKNGLPAGSQGLPTLDNVTPKQGSPIIPTNTAEPVDDVLSPSSTESLTDSPAINTLSIPEDDSTLDDDEFFGAGNQLLDKSKAGPLASDVEDDVDDSCVDCAKTLAEPTTSRVNMAEDTIKSDPLALKPLASDPTTAAPVVCATAPVTSMPAFTFPCLTNFDGSVGTMADMCIDSTQLNSRPASTFVCPEDMQDFTPDDLSLFRRDHHDEKWDLLNRSVGSFVRLCILSNNL